MLLHFTSKEKWDALQDLTRNLQFNCFGRTIAWLVKNRIAARKRGEPLAKLNFVKLDRNLVWQSYAWNNGYYGLHQLLQELQAEGWNPRAVNVRAWVQAIVDSCTGQGVDSLACVKVKATPLSPSNPRLEQGAKNLGLNCTTTQDQPADCLRLWLSEFEWGRMTSNPVQIAPVRSAVQEKGKQGRVVKSESAKPNTSSCESTDPKAPTSSSAPTTSKAPTTLSYPVHVVDAATGKKIGAYPVNPAQLLSVIQTQKLEPISSLTGYQLLSIQPDATTGGCTFRVLRGNPQSTPKISFDDTVMVFSN